MHDFLLTFLFPVLASAFIVMLIVAYKAMKVGVLQKKHVEQSEKGFEYTKQKLGDVSNNIQTVGNHLLTDVLPQMDAVYKHVVQEGQPLSVQTLVSYLKEIGYDNALVTGNKGQVVAFGFENNGVKISFMAIVDESSNDIVFLSFAYQVNEYTLDILSKLNDYNTISKTGKAVLQRFNKANILMVIHTLHNPNGKFAKQELSAVLDRLVHFHDDLGKLLSGLAYNQITFNEYMKLQHDTVKNEDQIKPAVDNIDKEKKEGAA